MVQWVILITVLITSSNGGTVDCTACSNQIVDCPNDGSTCIINCGAAGCKQATINCLDGYRCQIYLGGDESARLATINGRGATQLDVITGSSGNFQLEQANIICPNSTNAHCYVHCDSSGYQNCRELSINAENSNTFWLACENTNEACLAVDIWCPRKNNNADACTLNGQTDTGAMIAMKIYAVNGFRSMTIFNGISSSSIGWIYCLNDYSASCEIDPNAPTSQMTCLPSG
eukprot:318231_1